MIRVLLVDDFESFRRFCASQLGKRPELEIVAEVSDGLEAVERAEELQPDLILLDISLPGLNGIEAARQIRRRSPSSKILIISQDSSVDTVQEALNAGASGYVVKSDAARDLMNATDAVLRGEQFLGSRFAKQDFVTTMNGRPKSQKPEEGRHKVHFYSKEASLKNSLSRFVEAALKRGDSAIVVATAPHRRDLLDKLQALGVDVTAAQEQGRYISVDTTAAIASFMNNGLPDTVRAQALFGELIEKGVAAASSERPHVAVYGECVQVLWEQGNTEAAIQMEKVANELIKSYDIDMLCGYSLNGFQGQPGTEMFQRVCAEHSAVYCG